jgi:xeroderma pigmentosum group C-complementing protein
MLPEGAAHVPYRGSVRVCKRLGIDYAESVVDFEFGSRMAVPVIQGVVIAEEHYERVLEELRKDEAERTRKADEKKRKAVLTMWRRLLMGMRIMNQLREEYGDVGGPVPGFGHGAKRGPENHPDPGKVHADGAGGGAEVMAGGFLPDGFDEEDGEEGMNHTSGFFPVTEDGDERNDDLVIHEGEPTTSQRGGSLKTALPSVEEGRLPPTPVGLVKAKPRAKPRATKKKAGRRRRRRDTTDDESDGDEDDGDDDYHDQ